MTNQNNAAQAAKPQTVLSFDERERILCQFMGEPIHHDREMAIAIEQAVLSKLRAPVADDLVTSLRSMASVAPACECEILLAAANGLASAPVAKLSDIEPEPRTAEDYAIPVVGAGASAPVAITELRIEFTAGGVGYVSIESARAAVLAASRASAPVADGRKLLPCPFCGGEAFASYKTDEDDIRWHSIHCRTECRGYGKHGSEEDAIAAWNTRTTLLRKYPNDEEIIDLAVEPLGIDCDRMPYGVVLFARALLSRYAAPQASEADVPTMASSVINDACWKFVETMPHQLPGPVFNDLKPALYAAVCHVLAELRQRARASIDLDAAAKALAEPMDYPWVEMPEQGRAHMREHAQSVVNAALSAQPAQKEQRDEN